MSGRTLKLTEKHVPSGSKIAVFSDLHIPHVDVPAVKLAIECCEREGVTHIFPNGDIGDCGPVSRHEEKQKRAILDEGSLQESVFPGLWFYEWARTRPCILTRGNHEAWVEKAIASSPAMKGRSPESLMGLWEDGDGWIVLPSKSRIRLGSRCWEHGDGLFAGGSGGANPGARIRTLAPDQTTSIGHLHRKFAHFWTSYDENGIPRTRGAYGNGHLSIPEAHEDYAGTYVNWQQSFEITRVYWVDGKPRFTTDQPEIFRDKRGRPYFEYNGKVYR